MRPMIRQPQGRVIPNKAGFPYPGIGFLLGNDPEDIFGIRRLSYANNPELVGNSDGVARRFVASQRTYATVTPPPDLVNLSQNFTGVLVLIVDEISVARVVHYSDTVNNQNLIVTLLATGHLNMSLGNSSGGGAQAGSTLPLKAGVSYTVVFGREVTNGFFMFINGVEQVRANSSGIANNVASGAIQIGRRSDNSNYFNGQVSLFAHMAGRPDSESLSRNPWQLFLEPSEESFALPPPGKVLSVTPAALVVTGGPATMLAARRLRAQPAGLTQGGGQVSVRAGRRLNVQPSALEALAGRVQLAVSRRLGVQPAALGVAGQNVAMRAGRRLQVAPIVLGISGGQMGMQYAPAPQPGSYMLPVSAAAMTLGAGSVHMRVARRLPVAGAHLELSMAAARLLVGRRLVVSPAALAMSAGPVCARAARHMRVQGTQLALAGGNVQLRYSALIEYARAPAGAGYAPQRVAVTARPAQTGGHRPPAIQETIR